MNLASLWKALAVSQHGVRTFLEFCYIKTAVFRIGLDVLG
jgi:hypothetical protein